MQKAKINDIGYKEHEVWLPECHEGDKQWLGAVLYDITTRHHEGRGEVGRAWRGFVMQRYENIYLNELDRHDEFDGPGIARRKANIFLRESHDRVKRMLSGETVKLQK